MGGKTNNAYKGDRQVPRLPLADRRAGRMAPVHRLRADHAWPPRTSRKKAGFYEKNPGTDISVRQLTNKPPTANSKGLRFGNYVQGREVIEEEIEAVLTGKKEREAGDGRRGAPRQRDPAQVRGGEQGLIADRGRRPPFARWKSASSSVRPGCRTCWSRRRSRSRSSSSSGPRSRRSTTRSWCRTRSASTRSSSGSATSSSSSTTRRYLESFKVTAVFSVLVTFVGLAVALLLAVAADRVVRGAMAYKTLLIWPYAVASAVAGVLWAFLFAPSVGIISFVAARPGRGLELGAARRPGDAAGGDRHGVEADQLQLPLLPRRACSRSRAR